MRKFVGLLLALQIATAAAAQNISPEPLAPPPTYFSVIAMPVPVIAGDITDRPYRVIGEIETGVRKATIFSKDPSEEKVYRELWERGQKMGADAVIFAEFGDPRVTALSWGSRKARGKAIKFLTDAEIALLPKSELVAPALQATAPGEQLSLADELAKLADLRDRGILTEEEFQAQKTKLLAE